MAILSDHSLEFAKEHISKFYDSDFFPKSSEFDAIWHHWPEVKKELLSKNVSKMWIAPPRAMAAPKPRGGYRIVHQLEPIEALVYTALAAEVAFDVEAARANETLHIACASRFKLADGSFFAGGTGWAEFNQRTETLAKGHEHILALDITDFYNQIYLHRLNNAIEHANPAKKNFADEIEKFISTVNSKSSQGVPVGPAASIVMSEAVLIDVDALIIDLGFSHTRYVDDFRIFANSKRELNRLLERLTLYLYENHRLTISSEKTKIWLSAEFITHHLHNHYTEEKIEIYETLEVFNPYTDDMEEIEVLVDDEEQIKSAQFTKALERVLSFEQLDLGLARSIIRSAKRHNIPSIAELLIQNASFFAPVINDVVLYLAEVTTDELIVTLLPSIKALLSSDVVDNELVRFWIEWYLARYQAFLFQADIHTFIFSGGNVENQARAAITEKNLAWVRDHKTSIFNLGGWARRAVLNAARILPGDEKKNWLGLVIANSPIILDRWVANWVLETT